MTKNIREITVSVFPPSRISFPILELIQLILYRHLTDQSPAEHVVEDVNQKSNCLVAMAQKRVCNKRDTKTQQISENTPI